VTVSLVELTKLKPDDLVAPFHCILEARMKLEPFTVRVKDELPTGIDEGLKPAGVAVSALMVGTGFSELMVNTTVFEVPPPGVGLVTVTFAVPGLVRSDAGTLIVNRVAETKVVVLAAPFQLTTENLTYPVPFTVMVKAISPTVACDGFKPGGVAPRELMVGTGLVAFIVKFKGPESPPPGVGLKTLTGMVQGGLGHAVLERSDAGIAAVTLVAVTKVVVLSEPFHLTTELPTKPVPITVRVNAGSPTVADEGIKLEILGTGLLAAVMVKVAVLEIVAPLATVTLAVPGVKISVERIAAVSLVVETKVVVLEKPFHLTTEVPDIKAVPSTVNVKAGLPETADAGVKLVILKLVLLLTVILKACSFEVPPPGPGFTTLTRAVNEVPTSAAVIAAVICVEEK